MLRKLMRIALLVAVVELAGFLIGLVISKRLTRGDEASTDFQVAAIFGGRKFTSHARGLQSGSVISSMGGVDLDLRDVTLDERGADLELRAVMAGVRVVVPEEWAVDIEVDSRAGGVEARVTGLESLPEDAPRLNVHAVTRMGGVLVTTDI